MTLGNAKHQTHRRCICENGCEIPRSFTWRWSISNPEDRKMAYGLARDILRNRDATEEMIEYTLSLLPVAGYKALGLRLRLQRKLQGLSIRWEDM